MSAPRTPQWARLTLALLATAWMVLWFWVFSFAFSGSYFRYNLHSRVPTFVAAWLGAGGILLSAALSWRSRRSPLLASVLHAVGVAAALLPLVVTASMLRRAPDPWRLSGDDAMGVGIDFMLLCGADVASVAVFAVAATVRGLARRQRNGPPSARELGR